MKDQIISFETAKLAKKKGLEHLTCNHTYCIGYGTIKENKALSEPLLRKTVRGQLHLALAPTQSLLQKWLREEHSIIAYTEPSFTYSLTTNIGYYGRVATVNTEKGELEERFSDLFFTSTYEEALELALTEALELI